MIFYERTDLEITFLCIELTNDDKFDYKITLPERTNSKKGKIGRWGKEPVFFCSRESFHLRKLLNLFIEN